MKLINYNILITNNNINIDVIINKYKEYIYNYLSLSNTKYDIIITNGFKSYSMFIIIFPIFLIKNTYNYFKY